LVNTEMVEVCGGKVTLGHLVHLPAGVGNVPDIYFLVPCPVSFKYLMQLIYIYIVIFLQT